MTVFKFICFSLGQIGSMYSLLDALELPSSPPSIKNGLLSTSNCVVFPFFTNRGIVNCACAFINTEKRPIPMMTNLFLIRFFDMFCYLQHWCDPDIFFILF